MSVFEIKVIFIDGTEKILSDVADFGYNKDTGVYYAVKNGYKVFFNPSQVMYIGRKFDIDNEPRKWK